MRRHTLNESKPIILHIGASSRLAGKAFLRMVTPPLSSREILRHVHHYGVGSLNLTNITALFTGMVLALQTAYALSSFGAKMYIGEIVGMALVRELGPVLTALMVGGRVGSGITAELGSMKVTEQVDAIRSMGADPIRKLVAPRIWSVVISLPLLTIMADGLGILGGMIISVFEEHTTAAYYFAHIFRNMAINDIGSGISKSFCFAFIIGVIACYNGLTARGGADGVGRATTDTVYAAAIAVLIGDFFLTKLFLSL